MNFIAGGNGKSDVIYHVAEFVHAQGESVPAEARLEVVVLDDGQIVFPNHPAFDFLLFRGVNFACEP